MISRVLPGAVGGKSRHEARSTSIGGFIGHSKIRGRCAASAGYCKRMAGVASTASLGSGCHVRRVRRGIWGTRQGPRSRRMRNAGTRGAGEADAPRSTGGRRRKPRWLSSGQTSVRRSNDRLLASCACSPSRKPAHDSGHRGSLLLRCMALPSAPPCRLIQARPSPYDAHPPCCYARGSKKPDPWQSTTLKSRTPDERKATTFAADSRGFRGPGVRMRALRPARRHPSATLRRAARVLRHRSGSRRGG
jgi:hypothetical protein